MQIEMTTDPFYRMYPAYLGSAKMDDDNSFVLEDKEGHCFMSMNIFTTFKMNDAGDELYAKVTFDLQESLGFCSENLQVSTSFTDHFNFYIWGG